MKIWFYFARSGGGHRAPAKAIAEEILKLNLGDIQTIQVDLAERSTVFYRFLLEQFYIFLTQRTPTLYALIYKISQNEKIISFEYWLAEKSLKSSLKKRLLLEKPSLIIATHFLISPLRAAFRELGFSIPIIVVVTEPYSTPKVWFHYKDLDYIVFSESALAVGVAAGVPKEKLHLFSQVVSQPVLYRSAEEIFELKKSYGLDSKLKTVLVVGGGNGLPGGISLLEKILKENRGVRQIQAIVVCGTNEKMAKSAEKLLKKYPDQKLLVIRWTDKLAEIISLSDLVVSKAGAGVVWETLLHRKPLLITHFIYGQERGTMEFVVNNKLGWFEPNQGKAAGLVVKYLNDDALLGMVFKKHDELALQSGNEAVARFIGTEVMAQKAVLRKQEMAAH